MKEFLEDNVSLNKSRPRIVSSKYNSSKEMSIDDSLDIENKNKPVRDKRKTKA